MKKTITQEELKKILNYDPLTGIFTWMVSLSNRNKAGNEIDNRSCYGYVRIGIYGVRYFAHRLAWLYVHGYFPENEIDHKDMVRHHNWISNLREFTRGCNSRNCGNRNDNTSGVKGVSWKKRDKKWEVYIDINGKRKSLGIFPDFSEAVCHRLAAEQCLGWEKSESNSPASIWVKENVQNKEIII